MKACRTCLIEKPEEAFYVRRETGRARNDCKQCVKAYDRRRFYADPERHRKRYRELAKLRQERDPLARVRDWMRYRYGITIEQYEEQLSAQGGVCALCKGTDRVRLAVDHCHTTGAVRGILCSACNHGIGKLKDDVSILERATNYVKTGGIWKK